MNDAKLIMHIWLFLYYQAAQRQELNEAADEEQQPLMAGESRGPYSKLG